MNHSCLSHLFFPDVRRNSFFLRSLNKSDLSHQPETVFTALSLIPWRFNIQVTIHRKQLTSTKIYVYENTSTAKRFWEIFRKITNNKSSFIQTLDFKNTNTYLTPKGWLILLITISLQCSGSFTRKQNARQM